MTNETSSLVERVTSSFSQLVSVSADLNAVSDELGSYISYIDAALKKLNLGITVWEQVRGGSDPRDELSYWADEIGYAKINGRWGISLRQVSGDYRSPDDEIVEHWHFNDAPRFLRLESIGTLPQLLERLSSEAVKTAEQIKRRLAEVQAVALAVNPDARKVQPSSLAPRTVVKFIGQPEEK